MTSVRSIMHVGDCSDGSGSLHLGFFFPVSRDGGGKTDTKQKASWGQGRGQGRGQGVCLHPLHPLLPSLKQKSVLDAAISSADSVLKPLPSPKAQRTDPPSQDFLDTFQSNIFPLFS